MLAQANIPEETAGLCELALQELLANLVDHAYEGRPGGQIDVRLACDRERVAIQTEDAGIPAEVDLNDIHMPMPEELAEGGYGMAIIRLLMDEVRYEMVQGRNVWTLNKKLK